MPAAPRFSLDQLLVLDAIVQLGSFAAAARQIHRVPSAVSYTVQTLEEALGVEVFDRSGHRAVLSEAGRRLWEEAQEVLQRARQLDALATSLADGWEPEIRVVVDGAWPFHPVVAGLRALAEREVPTQVHVDVEHQDGVLDRFDADHADCMVALGLEDGGRLRGRELPPLEMVLVTGAGHPLAGRRSVTRDQLAEHVDLVVKDSSPAFAQKPRRTFLGTHRVVRFSDFRSKLAALREGLGFGWVPLHLARADLDAGVLVPVDLPDTNRWTYAPQLVTRREEPPGRAARLFMEALVASIESTD